MKVAKFGGSSLASAEQIQKVANIIVSDEQRRLIVVSAPGKRMKDDIKVTDLLITLADTVVAGNDSAQALAAVVNRYSDIAQGLSLGGDVITQIEKDLRERISFDIKGKGEARFIDLMKAAGEDNNAKLIAAYLASMGHNATYVNPKDAGLHVSHEYGNAQVLDDSYDALYKLRDRDEIMIFPGFFGYSTEGDVVTFPRGGSDITGAILAKGVQADVYENFTDVDSVFAVSPALIENPRPITMLTYREMRELSYAGFSVFHEEALFPVYHAGIPVNIKNTNNPSAPGTLIVMEREIDDTPVLGVASADKFACIYLSKYLMNREIGFGRKLLGILEDEKLSYEHLPSGIDNISVIISEKEFDDEAEARITERIKKELTVDDLYVERGLALVMIVGEGMRHSVGIAATATEAIGEANVNIEMINQGASEVSMMFGVKAEDADNTVRALYHAFF